MAGRYRPLLPQVGSDTASGEGGNSSSDPTSSSSPSQARTVRTACLGCRRRKIKCDGSRPTCGNCLSHGLTCDYDREPDTTPIVMLRRRHDELQNSHNQLKELFDIMRSRDDRDVSEIIRQLRTTEDPIQVLDFIKQGDLLVRPSVAPRDAPRTPSTQDVQAAGTSGYIESVHAKPWTRIAGDELVSELISIYFAQEHPFSLAFIDKDCFLSEMRSGKEHAVKYCSQLLVNAICALCCFASDSVKKMPDSEGEMLREQFFDEAKRLLRLPDIDGSASLPTVQAFYLMSMYECTIGLNRETLVERVAAFGSMERYSLDSQYDPIGRHPREEVWRDRRAVSTVVWGSFCVQCLKSVDELKKSTLRLPSIPRYFQEQNKEIQGAADLGASNSWRLLQAVCDLSETMHNELQYNYDYEAANYGTRHDVEKRMKIYHKVLDSRRRLSDDLAWDKSRSSHSLYLSNYYDNCIISLFRPLPRNTEIDLPEGKTTSGKMTLLYCEKNIRDLEDQEQRHGTMLGPLTPLYAPYQPYTVSLTLISHLDDLRTHECFTRACRLLWRDSRSFPVAAAALAALLTVAQRGNLALPSNAVPYFHQIEPYKAGQTASFDPVLPQYLEMITSFSEENRQTGLSIGPQMGQLIDKWSEFSISKYR